MRAIVIGAGVAGAAAAWSAARAGCEVTLVSAGAGASAMMSGAVDDAPWEERERAARLVGATAEAPLPRDVGAFVHDLGIWDAPERARPWIATLSGRLRPARARDRSLLDLGALEGACVLVPRAPRGGWDADAIARTLAVSEGARERRLTFRAVDVAVLRYDDERRASDMELAGRHDDADRLAWLAERLRERLQGFEAHAVLLGPWLGASAPRADALARLVGVPCGEALVGAGSPAGLRFEAARDGLLERSGVRRVTARAARVAPGETTGDVVVHLSGSDAPLESDVVVLAIGGVAGGGVVYAPPERWAKQDLAPRGKVPFELSVDAGRAGVELSSGHRRLEISASMQGPELDGRAWPSSGRLGALETVGIQCQGLRAGSRVWAAGDAVAGRARTVLEAVASGIAAGAALGD